MSVLTTFIVKKYKPIFQLTVVALISNIYMNFAIYHRQERVNPLKLSSFCFFVCFFSYQDHTEEQLKAAEANGEGDNDKKDSEVKESPLSESSETKKSL